MSELNILYQDEHLAAAVKPYGVLSEEDHQKPNMPAMLRAALGCASIVPVHRLDRTTQGLMVYAKTPDAAARLSGMIQSGGLEKTYLAVVEGAPAPPAAELCDLLYYDRRHNKSYVVRRERRGVKQARLRYETLGTAVCGGADISLLKIRLLTGRTHQIRVQLASRQTPLVGDRRYGGRISARNIMLCASELCFVHPFTGEKLCFSYRPTDEWFGLFQI